MSILCAIAAISAFRPLHLAEVSGHLRSAGRVSELGLSSLVRESDLLAHIFKRSADLDRFPHVVVGPGHDCAVIALPGGECALAKTDQLIEGLHFAAYPRTPVNLIARKAIARAISDIAAAGGRPLATLIGAVLPPDCPYASDLYDALSRWAAHWNAPLIGGDTAIWHATDRATEMPALRHLGAFHPAPRPLILSISIIGSPHRRRGPVLRSGASPGDAIYISGRLGGSFDPDTALGKHLTFDPRLAEAAFLCDELGDNLHAMMDISDGLGRDATRLAAVSGVRIVIDAEAIPLNPNCTWQEAAATGEDYELLFAAPPEHAPLRCPVTGVLFTRIGSVVKGSGCSIREGPTDHDCSQMGWEHGG